jgi:outer membrane protein assembly factor BamB
MKTGVALSKVVLTALLAITTVPGLAQQPGTVRWRIPLTASYFGTSVVPSPAIASDGTIYVGTGLYGRPASSDSYKLYSISPGGTTNWVRSLGSTIYSSPAVGPDGTIYVGTKDVTALRLFSISKTGLTNWSFRAGAYVLCSPGIGADGTVYFTAVVPNSNVLIAVRPDGTTNWICSLGPVAIPDLSSAQFSSPAIGPDGTIYVGSVDANVYAISPEGKTNWLFPMGRAAYSSPAVGSDGTVYIGSDDARLYAIDHFGSKKWDFLTSGMVECSPALGSAGTVYVGCLGTGGMYALNSNGIPLWTNAGVFSASPAVTSNGTVYCDDLGTLRAWDSSGSNIWSVVVNSSYFAFSSPAIGLDGTVYVAGQYDLWAINGSGPPAQSPWPTFRRNAQHTARAIQCGLAPPVLLSSGSATLTCRVETNRPYRVSASTDLTTWTDVGSFASSTNLTQFLDPDAPNFPQRFYRLATP